MSDKQKILLVEDDADLVAAMQAALEADGYEISVANDPQEGMRRALEEKPDLMILDVMFPNDDAGGFNLAIELRKQDTLKDLPVLMLTGINKEFSFNFDASDIDKQWLPVTQFLEKSEGLDEVKARVASMLK